jgi:EmrB/QacA subfamily drug resistance transporter
MDTTIVYVAIPTIQPELDASGAGLQWIVDSYVIVFAGLLLTMGALGDRFGRRHLLQIGVAIFGLASIFAAFAGSTGELITARALTGIGGAMMLPATLSIVIDVFPQHERAKAIAIWSAVAGIGAPTGQIVGGVLLEYFWWGSVFLINVPVTAFIFAASALIVPNSRDIRARPVDLPGAVLSSATLSALVFAIIEAAERGWTDPLVLGGFAAAAILTGVFATYELRTRFPMIDLRLLKNRRLSAGAAAMITSFLVMLGGFFLLSQFLQFARGYSALETGLILIPFPLGFALASTFSERAVVSMGTNRIAAGGLGLLALSLALMSFFTLGTEIWVMALVLLAFGMGGGAVMAPGTVAMMEGIPEESSGAGAALNEVTRLIGIALGVSILGSIANSAFSSDMERGVPGVPNEATLEASDSIGSAHQVAAGLGGAPGEALALAANSAYVDAFTLATLVAAGIAAVAAVVILRVMPARQSAAEGTTLSHDEDDLTTELAAPLKPIRGGADVGRRQLCSRTLRGQRSGART